MIEDAILCLKNQYNENRPYVEGNDFFTYYFNEKQRHSMQVFGAGNMLVRHIDWLKNKPAEYIEMVRTAVLLHDVYRFKEIALKATENKNIDHGIEGAEFLRNIPQFSDIRIWLPIYHHGHLIEDEQYQNIADEQIKKEVELICFVVRDADKIANLHMLAYEENMHPLFFGTGTGDAAHDYSISDFAREDVLSGKTVRRTHECTIADRMLGYLSWFNDINYQYSIEFCRKRKVIELLKSLFEQACNDKAFVEEYFAYFDECLRLRAFLS